MKTDLILTCDPDLRTQRALQVILRGAGYQVLSTGTGEQALECVDRERPRAVIHELALPDIGGIELCRRLRERGEMAILVLSGVDDDATKIEALELGADDYLTKPFSPGELLARLGARLRAAGAQLRLEVDGVVIDLTAHLVAIDGHEVHLTPTEFALLRVLVTSRGPVTHCALASAVWGPQPRDAGPRVRTHIANLRAKLDRDLIRTEVGIGYRFAAAPALTRAVVAGS